MGYFNEDQLQKYFQKAIDAKANEKIAQLRAEIDKLYDRGIKKVKEDVQIKKQLEVSKALKDVQVEYQDKINSIGFRYDESLISERKKMTDYIFDEVTKELNDFIKTKKYEDLMSKKIQKIVDKHEKDPIKFLIKTNDNVLADFLVKKYKNVYPFDYSNKIKLGGFVATISTQKIEYDETIDSKLEDRRIWFYQNSNLFIRK